MREKELIASIVDEFLSIRDPRVARTRKYDLSTVLTIALLAVICGADSLVDMERFAIAKRDWLKEFLDIDEDVPAHDTFGRVLGALSTDDLSSAFARWSEALSGKSNGRVIAIDGKTLRGTISKANENAFVHMVSAWSCQNNIVLGQVKTEDKSNEITAIPRLLELINVAGATVTIDAMGCQTQIASKIIQRGGDYLLAVKGNQPTLHESIISHFNEPASLFRKFDRHSTEETGHGRFECRRAWVSISIESIVASCPQWEQLNSLVRVESTRVINGITEVENRYFISSIPGLSAADALRSVRSHWGIENSLHWVLDMAFREDESRVRAKNAGANFGIIRHIALGMLKARSEVKIGIRAKRLVASWDHDFLLRTIGVNKGSI